MRRLRMRLPLTAALWLFCQMAGLVAAPVVFASTVALVPSDEGCECPDVTPGGACPMHQALDSAKDGAGTCHMRGACVPADVALLSLAGGMGVLSRPTAVNVTRPVVSLDPLALHPIARTDVPDAPPPRA